MRWIKIDKNEFKEELANGCHRMTTFCQWVNGCLISLIGFSLSNDALEFAIGYIWMGFSKLEDELYVACLKDIQFELVNGFVWSLILIFVLRLICAYLAKKSNKYLGKEIKKRDRRIRKLEKDICRYKVFETGISSIVKIYFSSVAKRCGLGVTERVSFYILERKGILALSERYATNPDYQTVSRETYPDTEGIISLARRKISVMVEDLPDYEVDAANYISVSKTKFSLSVSSIKALTMKARFYYAYRFSSPDQCRYNGIAVIESMVPKFSTKKRLDEVFMLDNDFIYNLVDTFKTQLPRLKISMDKEL